MRFAVGSDTSVFCVPTSLCRSKTSPAVGPPTLDDIRGQVADGDGPNYAANRPYRTTP